MIRVMICDDIKEIRSHYKDIINNQQDMRVVCEASTTAEAIQKALEYKPDIVLMDIQMDELNSGIIATQEIVNAIQKSKIIVVTIHANDDIIMDAYLAGAIDYMLKGVDESEICDKIRSVFSSQEFLGRRIADVLRENIKASKREKGSLFFVINNMMNLTSTERVILKELCQKKKRQEIAKDNYMSEETVKLHIRHILRKLNFSSTYEMTSELNKMGIVEYLI